MEIPTTLADLILSFSRLDKQGSIEENVIFVNRQFSFDIDDMLAAQNSYGAGGTSYGLFDNDEDMALNLRILQDSEEVTISIRLTGNTLTTLQ